MEKECTTLVDWLPMFFRQWSTATRKEGYSDDTSLADWLPTFFQQWSDYSSGLNTQEKRPVTIDTGQLADFFSKLKEPLQAVSHRSLSFDPWKVAGLERKEVDNTALLAWLLSPQETHGFGRKPLHALLQSIQSGGAISFPTDFEKWCQVQTETCPNGDQRNRVDLEIDADNFFLLIEAKIGAPEQERQIDRYCEEAIKRAGTRPWRIIFLTSSGYNPITCSPENEPFISSLSWRGLATALETAMREDYRNLFSATQGSPMKQIAAHAVFCFLEHVKNFN